MSQDADVIEPVSRAGGTDAGGNRRVPRELSLRLRSMETSSPCHHWMKRPARLPDREAKPVCPCVAAMQEGNEWVGWTKCVTSDVATMRATPAGNVQVKTGQRIFDTAVWPRPRSGSLLVAAVGR